MTARPVDEVRIVLKLPETARALMREHAHHRMTISSTDGLVDVVNCNDCRSLVWLRALKPIAVHVDHQKLVESITPNLDY